MDVNEELKFLRKFTKTKFSGEVWGVRVGGGGGQVGCERRIEVFVKIQKKNGGGGRVGGSGWGGQGGCEGRIEVFGKIHKNKFEGGREGGGVRRVGGGQDGCERNVGGRG